MIDFDDAPDSNQAPFRPGPNASYDPTSHEKIPNYIDSLNERQREAVLITEGPLIVLAGAGSGKTKMLTSRIAYLIETKRVPGHSILAVTFTNKAAGEMRDRVEKTLNLAAGSLAPSYGRGSMLGNPEIGTFHSVCVRVLRRELNKTPFTKPFVIYDDSDQLSLLKGVMDKLQIDEKSFNPKSFQSGINRIKCDAVEPQDFTPALHNIFERQLKRVYEQYQKDLFTNNALDFGEIITMPYRILRDHPEVRSKYQHRFKYIHVDEYQDTNRAQYLLLSMLAGKPSGGHQNICVVGDEDQSIYKWRGADIRNILDFDTDYPGAQVVKLEQNYRSTKTIIHAASQVIKNNTSRKDKTLWTENEEGQKLIHAQLPDERAEAELTIREIKRLAGDDGRSFGDFAIFYRTNAQSRQFEDVFRREKISYQIVGGLRFYDRKEIKDILSYFKAIQNSSDSVSLKRIINVPGRGIGRTTLDKIDDFYAAQRDGLSYWQVLESAASDPSLTSASTAKKIGVFVQLLQRLMDEQPKLLLSELYHLILDETGYVRELRKEGTDEALARIENLEEFDNLLQEFEEDRFHSLETDEAKAQVKPELLPIFMEQTSLASDVDLLDNLNSTVKLMTLHSSKGLEFPIVFLVGMEEGLFPSLKPWEETPEENIEEERRLCYVGMTRAREILYLMNVVARRIWGNVVYQDPSRFFLEIPENLVDFKDFTHAFSQNRGGGGAYRVGPSTSHEGSAASRDRGSSGPKLSVVPNSTGAFGQSGDLAKQSTGRLKSNSLVGQTLNHPDYGTGTIVKVEGSGDDQRVTVEFRGRDQRKFLSRYLAAYLES